MTTLLLDVGNSRLKWGLARNGAIHSGGAVQHHGDPAAVVSVLDLPVETTVAAVRVANVTGTAHGDSLSAALQRRFGVAPQFAAVQQDCSGLSVAYADPSRFGIDRWLQMLALWRELKGAFVVASAGTALTFDAVDADGHHLGGVIAPGLVTAQRAVLGATRFAADGPDDAYSAGLGTDTEACVRQGALHACAGLIERLAARFAPDHAACLLAGGDAARLAPHLDGRWSLRSDLVLEGLLALVKN